MKKYLIISLTILFVAIGSHQLEAQCVSQVEFEALVAIYNATGGDNWTNNTGWDINATACDVSGEWYGLTRFIRTEFRPLKCSG